MALRMLVYGRTLVQGVTVVKAFEIVECEWKNCTRKIAEGDRYCDTHDKQALKAAENIAKAQAQKAYNAKFKNLKTLEGLAHVGAEMIYRIMNPREAGTEDDPMPSYIYEPSFLKGFISLLSFQRQVVMDTTLERRMKAIDIVLREKLGVSAQQLLAYEDREKVISAFETARIAIKSGTEIPEDEFIDVEAADEVDDEKQVEEDDGEE